MEHFEKPLTLVLTGSLGNSPHCYSRPIPHMLATGPLRLLDHRCSNQQGHRGHRLHCIVPHTNGRPIDFTPYHACGFVVGPESPRWLLRKGKQAAAESALLHVHRGEKYTPDEDIEILQRDIDEEAIMASESRWIDLVKDLIERRKVIYSAGALIAQQINGIQWFYYFVTVFLKSIGLEDPFLMTLIVLLPGPPANSS